MDKPAIGDAPPPLRARRYAVLIVALDVMRVNLRSTAAQGRASGPARSAVRTLLPTYGIKGSKGPENASFPAEKRARCFD